MGKLAKTKKVYVAPHVQPPPMCRKCGRPMYFVPSYIGDTAYGCDCTPRARPLVGSTAK